MFYAVFETTVVLEFSGFGSQECIFLFKVSKTLLEPCGYGYKVVCTYPNYTKPTVIYRGSIASKKLIDCLVEEQNDIEQILQTTVELQWLEH